MKDCSQNLGPRLRHLSNRITQYMDQQFLALDLTSTQSFILHHLVLHEGVPNTKTIPIVFEKYKLNSATSTADNIPPINIAKIPSIITSNICIKKSFL